MDNNPVPVSSIAEYQKWSTLLNCCFEGSSIDQKLTIIFFEALFHSPVVSSRKNFYEHHAVKSESGAECFIAFGESMDPIMESLSSVNGMQMVTEVKFLIGCHRTDNWAICYQGDLTKVNSSTLSDRTKISDIFDLISSSVQ